MSNLKVHLVYNGEPCLVLSLSKMVKHDFGKVLARTFKVCQRWTWHVMTLSSIIMSCHDIVNDMSRKCHDQKSCHGVCHGDKMLCHVLSHIVIVTKKKCVTTSKKPVRTLTGKSKKRARFTPTIQAFLSWSKRPFFCHGLSRWQTMTTLWQTVTNRDKPWQTMTNSWQNHDNHDKPWQYYDKPWQSLTIPWQTLAIVMTNLNISWQYHVIPWQYLNNAWHYLKRNVQN